MRNNRRDAMVDDIDRVKLAALWDALCVTFVLVPTAMTWLISIYGLRLQESGLGQLSNTPWAFKMRIDHAVVRTIVGQDAADNYVADFTTAVCLNLALCLVFVICALRLSGAGFEVRIPFTFRRLISSIFFFSVALAILVFVPAPFFGDETAFRIRHGIYGVSEVELILLRMSILAVAVSFLSWHESKKARFN